LVFGSAVQRYVKNNYPQIFTEKNFGDPDFSPEGTIFGQDWSRKQTLQPQKISKIMKNFIFRNPTKLIFGRGMIARIAKEIPAGNKLMITFGGGSVKSNGVYEQVVAALEGRDYVEFWGIEPNPTIETLRKAVAQCKKEGVNFLLAVGGGSVLDGTKLIAAGVEYDGDPWDIVKAGQATRGIPFASIMTLPATGSEMNSGAVISRSETKEKFAFYGAYPVFSVLDPETTYSLPPYQVAVGLTDVFVHVMEQYLTTTGQSRVMDRWAEGLLHTVIEIAPLIRCNQHDYDTMADFMLAATMALNDFIRMGVTQDWATHMIGHELTAIHDMTHGQSLAIVLPSLMRVMSDQKREKILQYAERIWNITSGSEPERIERAICATEEFFRSLGLQTRLSEMNIGQETILEIERRFQERNVRFGENQNVDGKLTRRILEGAM
jgi:NADP-dependent alcohol dehydrogenase